MELRTTLEPGLIPLKRYLVPQPTANPTTRTEEINAPAKASTREYGAKMYCIGIRRIGQSNTKKQR